MPNPDIDLAKKRLRRHIKTISVGDEPALSKQIVGSLHEHLRQHPEFHCVSLFAALPGEPDLRELVPLMPDRHFVFPRIRDDVMEFHRIRDLSELEPGTWGIYEPKADSPVIDPHNIDLLLCPGLAFTPKGQRLGKGKAYYDRYLTRYENKRPPCYGVTFAAFLCDAIPCDGHDIRMDRVLTEASPRSEEL